MDAMTSPVKTRFRAAAVLAMAAGSLALRPGFPGSFPRACAALMPAFVRSEISARSSCATAPRTWSENMPWGVDVVAQGAKMGAALLQAVDDVEEMADRAREAVEADDDENIAWSDLAHQSCELWPSARGARPVFLVNCRATGRAQLIGLRVRCLVLGRDASVAQKTSCRTDWGAGEGSAGHESLLLRRCGPVCTISEVAGKRPFAGVSELPVQPRPLGDLRGLQARQPYAWRASEAPAASETAPLE